MKIRHCLKCRDNGGQVHNIVITHMHVKNLYIKQRKIRKFGFFLGRAWKIYHTLLLVALCMNGIECEEGKVTKKNKKEIRVREKMCLNKVILLIFISLERFSFDRKADMT